jgi:hypothetical protein
MVMPVLSRLMKTHYFHRNMMAYMVMMMMLSVQNLQDHPHPVLNRHLASLQERVAILVMNAVTAVRASFFQVVDKRGVLGNAMFQLSDRRARAGGLIADPMQNAVLIFLARVAGGGVQSVGAITISSLRSINTNVRYDIKWWMWATI